MNAYLWTDDQLLSSTIQSGNAQISLLNTNTIYLFIFLYYEEFLTYPGETPK